MRTVLLLTVIFVTCAAAAQTASSKPTEPAPTFRTQNQVEGQSPRDPFELPRNAHVVREYGPVCLKIRSYIFERQDGEAPRLVGMTTCTPSTKFTAKRAESPQWGIYPAVGGGAAPAVERQH